MDNPVEVVFTAGGERIFTTTFLQNPANGRRDGLIHAVYGGVYGKVHDVIDDQVRTGPELMPVLAHLGPAASCGLVRYESAIFGKEYRDNLFSTSFNLHKVFRHVLTPDGATFACKTEDFLTSDSLDFHPTHLIEDADGSLIVVDTGGWYKLCCPTSQIGKPDVLGAIYRVRRVDGAKVEDGRGLKMDWDRLEISQIGSRLADPRPAVQKRAMEVLVRSALPESKEAPGSGRAVEVMRALGAVAGEPDERGRVNAIWTLCRIDSPEARAMVRGKVFDNSADVRHAAIHSAGLWRDKDAVEKLFAPLNCPVAATRRAAAEALGQIGDARAVGPILAAFEKPADQVLTHSLTYALIQIGSGDEVDRRYWSIVSDAAKSPAVRRAALVVLDQTNSALLAKLKPDDVGPVVSMLQSDDQALSDAAIWVISHHPAWGSALAAGYRELIKTGVSDSQAMVARLQLSKLAKSPAIQELLADAVGNAKTPRQSLLVCLGAMADASLSEMPSSWLAALSVPLAEEDLITAGSATQVVRKFSPKKMPPSLQDALLNLGERDSLTGGQRLAALSALPPLKAKDAASVRVLSSKSFEFLSSKLSQDQSAQDRLQAAEILGRSRLSREQLVSLASLIKAAGPLEIDHLLGAFSQESADDAVAKALLDSLGDSKFKGSLRADSVRRSLKKFGPKIQEQAEALLASVTPDAAKNKARLDELLANQKDGDVRRGQLVFNSTKAACSSCHTIGYVGGRVGPDLTKVGAIRTERDLLESIVFPSSSFVQSFEPIIVETNDGDVKSGILKKNDDEAVLLVTGPEQEVRISRKEIKSMRPGALSVMPAGLDQQLSAQDLTDLVTFLKACK